MATSSKLQHRNVAEGTGSPKKIIIFLAGLMLIVFISFINLFPKGYVFAGGDIIQFVNLGHTFGNLFFTWNMAGFGAFLQYFSYSLYYLPFYLLTLLGLSQSSQSFLFFFIFLGGSYVSFFLASKGFKSDQSNHSFEFRIILSLLYALNPYTLYAFLWTWGYSPFLILYPLIPLIFSLTYSYYSHQSLFNRNLAALGIVFFLSNIAFGNFSFFAALILFLAIFVICLYILRLTNKKIILKIPIYLSILVAATFWTIVPSLIGLISSFSWNISSNTVFNLSDWILYTRVSVSNQLFLTNDVVYYISNLPLFLLGSAAFFVLMLISLRKLSKMSLIFLILALVSIFITAKGEGIVSDKLAIQLFSVQILSVLRSPDKTFIFLPFFFIIVIYIGLHDVYAKSSSLEYFTKKSSRYIRFFKANVRKIILVCFLLIILGVSPFITGGIQTRYSYGLDSSNYQTSTYSYLVHIPSDYYSAEKIINADPVSNKILNLPYSVINSVGWVNYPKWQVVGVDPTTQLFNKPSIEANNANTPFWQEWNSVNPTNSTWMIKLMSLYNVQYLIYHKDVDDQFINQTIDKINYLQNEGYINLIADYPDFNLYNLSSSYFLPQIHASSNITLVQGSWDQLLSAINSSNITTNNAFFVSSTNSDNQWQSLSNYYENYIVNGSETIPQIVFQEINPTNYQVKIENATQPFFLIFSQGYDSGWNAYINTSEQTFGTIIANYPALGVQEANSITRFTPGDVNYLFKNALPDSDHFVVNNYANAWYIDPSKIANNQNGTFEISLFYQPQSYYYVGLIISGTTFVACVLVVLSFTQSLKALFSYIKKKQRFLSNLKNS